MEQSVVIIHINNKDTNFVAERRSKELNVKGCLLLVQEFNLGRVRTIL